MISMQREIHVVGGSRCVPVEVLVVVAATVPETVLLCNYTQEHKDRSDTRTRH